MHRIRIRDHVLKSGKPKKVFTAKELATEFINAKNIAAGYKTYQCSICDQWHIGRRL